MLSARTLCVGWSAALRPGTGASFSHHLKVSPPQLQSVQLTAVRDTRTWPGTCHSRDTGQGRLQGSWYASMLYQLGRSVILAVNRKVVFKS